MEPPGPHLPDRVRHGGCEAGQRRGGPQGAALQLGGATCRQRLLLSGGQWRGRGCPSSASRCGGRLCLAAGWPMGCCGCPGEPHACPDASRVPPNRRATSMLYWPRSSAPPASSPPTSARCGAGAAAVGAIVNGQVAGGAQEWGAGTRGVRALQQVPPCLPARLPPMPWTNTSLP